MGQQQKHFIVTEITHIPSVTKNEYELVTDGLNKKHILTIENALKALSNPTKQITDLLRILNGKKYPIFSDGRVSEEGIFGIVDIENDITYATEFFRIKHRKDMIVNYFVERDKIKISSFINGGISKVTKKACLPDGTGRTLEQRINAIKNKKREIPHWNPSLTDLCSLEDELEAYYGYSPPKFNK